MKSIILSRYVKRQAVCQYISNDNIYKGLGSVDVLLTMM